MERANNCLLRGAKLCARILEEVAKAILWSNLSRRRHSGFCYGAVHSGLSCRVEDTLVITVEQDTLEEDCNGPVEEVRERRGLRQTSWEAQLPVDHADPTDRIV
ncbi:hypothetical protein PV328_012134, partial [Microctonus aethiopoides]